MAEKKIETGTAETDYYEELVEYTAPPDYSGKDTRDILVAVNGETIRIRRGSTVKIKRKFLLALEDAARQDEAARELQRREGRPA